MHNTPHTEASKEKMRIANKGKHHSPETQFKKGNPSWNNGLIGIIKHSEQSNKNKAELMKGNTRNSGKLRSEETKIGLRGKKAWNKGTTGIIKANTGSFKKGQTSGDKNARWMGGISTENEKCRHSEESKNWQKKVKERDNYSCQKCDEKRRRYTTAHHILNFSNHIELRFNVDNGITFCRKCHKAFHIKYGVRNNNLNQVEEFLLLPLNN